MLTGAICVPSFVTNNVEDNAFICKNSKSKIIILENENIFKNNQEFLKNFDPKRKIIIIDKSALFLDYYQIISQKKKTIKTPVIKEDDISTIIYTSGTSGNPKGVVLNHKSILDNLNSALEIINEFGIGANERFFSFLPFLILMRGWQDFTSHY